MHNNKNKKYILGKEYLVILGILIMLILIKESRKLSLFEIKGVFLEVKKRDEKIKNTIVLPEDTLVYIDSIVPKEEDFTLKNLKEVLNFSKINYKIEKDSESFAEFSKYKNIILLKTDYYGFSEEKFQGIKDAVENGATLFYFVRSNYQTPFFQMLRLKPQKLVGDRINIKEKFYPGINYLEKNINWVSAVGVDQLDLNSKLLIEDNKKNPLVYEISYGKGRVLCLNLDNFSDCNNTGLLKQLISYGSDFFISPVLNAKVIHIDDFPLPLSGSSKNIMKEYRRDNVEFIKEIWFPDLVKISKEKAIKYTSFLIYTYDIDTEKKELDNDNKINKNLIYQLGRMALKENFELGIHGYNHNPLLMEKELDYSKYSIYSPWRNEENMIYSQNRFSILTKDIFGKNFELYSYVPPNNLLSESGIRALKKAHPYLTSISGLYGDEITYEKGTLSQRVGEVVGIPGLYHLPRFSAGYKYSEKELGNIVNGMSTYGYISHFIHPDDILVEDARSFTKVWQVMKGNFEKLMEEINVLYPKIIPMYQVELGEAYRNIEGLQIENIKTEEGIMVLVLV